jgi:hypothetical protein
LFANLFWFSNGPERESFRSVLLSRNV